MRASFYDSAFVDDTDFIGILDGRETMGDGDRRTRLHQPLQSILYESFTLRVQGRGGFVENQDWRILQNGTGDAYTLTLSTRKSATAIADVCIKFSLRGHDKVVGVGDTGSLFNLVVSGIIDTK